jgi:hypothetical protein
MLKSLLAQNILLVLQGIELENLHDKNNLGVIQGPIQSRWTTEKRRARKFVSLPL